MSERSERKRMELHGAVKRQGSDQTYWTRIGTAFENKDRSWNLRFDYLPADPKTTVQMREPKPKDE